ncbi:hypothetical protein F0562_036051 [Nyssa sinensis]|uniref:Uncharacterized protein n=1 Tax=Nyssa sinensis TaxID=561372 RepID=A0A5J5AG60_9ASTE|nr:hypothetical protein F0562_036051 [Nyssa sinensis]
MVRRTMVVEATALRTMAADSVVSYLHVKREVNVVAHAIAGHAKQIAFVKCWIEELQIFLCNLLQAGIPSVVRVP